MSGEFPHPNAERCLTQPARDNLIKAVRFRDNVTRRWRKGLIRAIGVGQGHIHGIFVEAENGGDTQWVPWADFEFKD